ncbi:MAG TPA: hypothetical protein PK507_03110 [bacterium]|jgi:hypothetical protein|nr:hypothetical protein [bacterium]
MEHSKNTKFLNTVGKWKLIGEVEDIHGNVVEKVTLAYVPSRSTASKLADEWMNTHPEIGIVYFKYVYEKGHKPERTTRGPKPQYFK